MNHITSVALFGTVPERHEALDDDVDADWPARRRSDLGGMEVLALECSNGNGRYIEVRPARASARRPKRILAAKPKRPLLGINLIRTDVVRED